MTKRRCVYIGCEAMTSRSLGDFADIGWSAMSWNRNAAACLCSLHSKLPDSSEILTKASRGLYP